MALKQRPPMSFTIANNLLTTGIKATDLGIIPKTLRMGLLIWGIMVKAWVNKILSKIKVC
jgi:cell shape-determining protein MreD